MNKFIALLMFAAAAASCNPQSRAQNSGTETVMKPEKNDEGEWDIDVLDTQYNYFLTAVAKPMSMYSESFLKNRNTMLVSEWNSLYYSGRYRNVIESSIDYDPRENYGIKFEYKLYQVFAYVSWKYGLKLNGLSGADAYR